MRRVAINVEPDPGIFTQNTQRTHLIRASGESLPWEDWGAAFKQVMPRELVDFIQSERQKIVTHSDEESIKNRLKKYANLYSITKYKAHQMGNVLVDPEKVSEGRTGIVMPDITKKPGERADTGNGGGDGSGITKTILSILKDDSGVKAKEVKPDPFPQFMWVSLAENTRDSEDGLEDRAARYVESENTIKGNKDFQGFKDVVDYFSKIYPEEDLQKAIIEAVYEYFQQQLIETVAGVLSLRGRKYWDYDQCQKAWSEEALTASVCCRYHILEAIDKQLGKSIPAQLKAASG
jgi:hypothetical protein